MVGRIPDFFVVGHSKSGTTALYRMLREHPQIYMPDVKEPRFFGGLRAPPGLTLPSTLEEYAALFAAASPGQIAGEATPAYLRTETAASEIAAANPNARCIAILREPASFVHSFHLNLRKHHLEPRKSLRDAIAAENEAGDGKPARRYSDLVRYVDQLRRFHAAFPEDQVLVLIYEEFRRDNETVLREVLRFLGVDDSIQIAPQEHNAAVRVRSFRLDSLVSYVYDGRGPITASIRRAAKAVIPERPGKAFGRIRRTIVYGKPSPQDDALMAELRTRYRPEVVALSEYLGRDLVSYWGYDDDSASTSP
jgi:hypothetical protein